MALAGTTSEAACLLGKTWGYDDAGVWVSDGCSGEFLLGHTERISEVAETASFGGEKTPEKPTWGALDTTGQGFLIGRSTAGELSISGYALVRYIDQLPAEQTFTDHLGNVRPIDTRRDVQFHRAMLHFKGWLASPKFRYQITVWTVMSTDQTTLYGFLGYQFNKRFNLYGGINTLGGTRSVFGSHPLWLAHDRVMADEFFRTSFTGSVWANGELTPGLWYHLAVANNLSQLGITAGQLTRDLGTGAAVWWMPTTKEFGPQGAYGDWEYHETLATRFGMSTAGSREDRQQLNDDTPENTQTRLADSVPLFETGSLAPGVTVQQGNYRVYSADAAIKYKGLFAHAEGYFRRLDEFDANGPLPVVSLLDKGFHVQVAGFPIKKKLEIYAATSWIYGDEDAGFGDSHEYLVGGNWYPFDSRYIRLNAQVIRVDRSPVSSVFGFYVGGQKGTTVSVAVSGMF